MNKTNNIYEEYHNYMINNKKQIQKSETCTCIECNLTFLSIFVTKFVYSGSTGLCPYCESDLIIPSYFCVENDKLKKWNSFINKSENTCENKNKKRRLIF